MLRKLAFLGLAAYAGRVLFNRIRNPEAADAGRSPDGAPAAGDGPGHRPTDLSGDVHPDGSSRADDHFRPDVHARVAEDERESLRPVTVPAPHD